MARTLFKAYCDGTNLAKERFEKMLKVNPAYIPRNHLVEEAINAAVYQNILAKWIN